MENMPVNNQPEPESQSELDADRRKFLASCGKFAAVTTPALTILLSTSLSSNAIASSGGGGSPDVPPWLQWLLDQLF